MPARDEKDDPARTVTEILPEREEKLRLLLENTPDIIYVADAENNLVYISPAVSRYGYLPEELLGKNLCSFVHPKDAERLNLEFRESLVTGRKFPSVFRALTKTGRLVYFEEYGRTIRKNGKIIQLIGIARDITERKQAEEKLRKRTEEINDLYNNAPCGYHSLDSDGVFLRMNDTELKWLGYTRNEIVGKKKWSDLLTPASLKTFHDTFPVFKKQGWINNLEFELVRKDGTILPALLNATAVTDANGNFVMSRSTLFDNTERKWAEEILRDSEEHFRQLYANMPSGVAVYEVRNDGEDFIFRDINRSGERIDQVKKKDLLGKSVTEVFPGAREFGLFKVFQRVWRTGRPEHHPVSFYRDNRIHGWRENYVYKLPGGEIVSVYDDVTERKQMEEERRDLQEQLLRAEKLAAIGELTAGVAHEINNPLTGIIGLSELLLMEKKGKLDGLLEKDLKQIHELSKRIEKIVTNLLRFARKKTPMWKSFYITEVLDTVLSIRSYEMQVRNIEIEKHYPSDLPPIMGDPPQLEQVVLSLINNAEYAIHETGESGKLTINVFLRGEKPARKVVIEMADTGPGIPEDSLRRIFDPFFTTKPVGKGTGLGLSVSYGIIKVHGGDIYARNREGGGAVFTIELPVPDPDKESKHES